MRTIKSSVVFAAAALVLGGVFGSAMAQGLSFRHTVTGEDLKVLEKAPEEGRDTEAVKHFLETGQNLYTEQKACLKAGEEAYLVGCSGCHGHVAEGKLGPGLNDDYWTYPKNKTDKGLFETIFGGAQGMMGPHAHTPLDEQLRLIAWIRHLYAEADPSEAGWLSDEQKANYKPFDIKEHEALGEKAFEGECKVSAN